MTAELIMPSVRDLNHPHGGHWEHHALPQRPHFSHTRSQSYQLPNNSNIDSTPITTTSQHTSPLHTPGATSPTSPGTRSLAATRQARPLFMPAVLRPTEFSSKLPRSPKNEDGPESPADLNLQRVNSSFISLPGLSMIGSRLSRRSTGDSGKAMDCDLDPELFPEVSGEPTRKHWKPDPHASMCDDPTCQRTFNYFNRRHHCRKCGNIFCDSHSAQTIPLDQDLNYNPRGSPSRSCGHCFTQFIAWKSRNNSQASSDQGSSVDTAAGPMPGTAIPTGSASPVPTSSPSGSVTLGYARGPEVAASVPRDWNWSTF
ncbi:FYVE-type zinc finger-containing protein C9B6.03 like [Verticillium longisporum]|uniref:FYVE-type zinc finger-containing protein C9B6.03 like n=2 Tax=Verticillium TaxID=1036719 RepID=A0A8I2Z7N0_VERLO|nr:hypothetical protein VdG1_08745 [Verticillium dahliae VDG1]KAG7116544.1 FYVE-type zinc finger-containing protein C9B6.03 like [Verticillium longisporum]PNH46233.1 hypothetical protein VD0004_g1797 [Verticillium dahliae]RBQ86081.1 hypothetical protein VDGD_05777 [Verticillium dahliae]RXG46358.1 hypothetical protein VDGE_05777 [Verticillium dahliae]